jgi:hypothetical protein
VFPFKDPVITTTFDPDATNNVLQSTVFINR